MENGRMRGDKNQKIKLSKKGLMSTKMWDLAGMAGCVRRGHSCHFDTQPHIILPGSSLTG